MLFHTAIGREFGERLHELETWLGGIAIAHSPAAGELLQAGMQQSSPEAVGEALMEIAYLPELFSNPAGFDPALEIAQGGGGSVGLLQSFECALGGQHSALDSEVNSFQAL